MFNCSRDAIETIAEEYNNQKDGTKKIALYIILIF